MRVEKVELGNAEAGRVLELAERPAMKVNVVREDNLSMVRLVGHAELGVGVASRII